MTWDIVGVFMVIAGAGLVVLYSREEDRREQKVDEDRRGESADRQADQEGGP